MSFAIHITGYFGREWLVAIGIVIIAAIVIDLLSRRGCFGRAKKLNIK